MSVKNVPQVYLPLKEAAEHFPGHPNWRTVRNWYRDGIDGILLAVVYVGGRVFVTPEAIEKFIRELSDVRSQPRLAKCRTKVMPTQREKAKRHKDATDRLQRAGCL